MQPSNELAVLVKPCLKMFYGGGAIIGVLNVVFASPERFHRRAVHGLTQETCFGNEVRHGLAPEYAAERIVTSISGMPSLCERSSRVS
jgi:hypothetical protein